MEHLFLGGRALNKEIKQFVILPLDGVYVVHKDPQVIS